LTSPALARVTHELGKLMPTLNRARPGATPRWRKMWRTRTAAVSASGERPSSWTRGEVERKRTKW